MHKSFNTLLAASIAIGVLAVGYFFVQMQGTAPASTTNSPNRSVQGEEVELTENTPGIDTRGGYNDWEQYANFTGTVQFYHPADVQFTASTIVFVVPDTYQKWLQKHTIPSTGIDTDRLLSAQEFTMGSLKGVKRIFDTQSETGGKRYKHTELIITDNTKVLSVDFAVDFGDQANEQDVIDTIARTVSFSDEQPVNASDWVSVGSDEFGFSLRIPSDYTFAQGNDYAKRTQFTISSPRTEAYVEETRGEASDAIHIYPRMTNDELQDWLDLPSKPSPGYFTSDDFESDFHRYRGPITIGEKTGYEIILRGLGTTKVTVLQQPDDTWFVLSSNLFGSWTVFSDEALIEPYDTIIQTLAL